VSDHHELAASQPSTTPIFPPLVCVCVLCCAAGDGRLRGGAGCAGGPPGRHAGVAAVATHVRSSLRGAGFAGFADRAAHSVAALTLLIPPCANGAAAVHTAPSFHCTPRHQPIDVCNGDSPHLVWRQLARRSNATSQALADGWNGEPMRRRQAISQREVGEVSTSWRNRLWRAQGRREGGRGGGACLCGDHDGRSPVRCISSCTPRMWRITDSQAAQHTALSPWHECLG